MKKFSFVLMALAMVSAGCSDENSSSNNDYNPESNKLVINGKVSDPAVTGAKIELIGKDGKIISNCGVNSNTLCNVWSKGDGSFKFVLPLGTDISTYSMQTTGGKDSEYGYEFDYSLSKNLNHSLDNQVIISPVTSLINEVGKLLNNHALAEEKVAQSLGINKNKLYNDPSGDLLVLTSSYIINSIITIDSQDNIKTIKDIAKEIKNGESLKDDKVLSGLFKNQVKLSEMKKVVAQMKDMEQKGLSTSQAIKNIKETEKVRMFSRSVMDLTVTENLSDVAKSNIKNMVAEIEKQLGNNTLIPLEQFIVDQLVNYMAQLDKELSKMATYEKVESEFIALLKKAIDSNTNFNKEVTLLISEKVYNINVPIDSPLGMDNQKRIEYYFNSTKDLNYKARQLTKIVLDDNIREDIYNEIIRNYAQFGLVNKADKILNTQIKNSLDRIILNSAITQGASWDYKNNAFIKKYVDKAYKDLMAFNGTNPDVKTKNYIESYISLMHGYASIQDVNNVIKVKELLFKKLNEVPIDGTPSRSTYYARAYNAIGNASNTSAAYQTIKSDNLEQAMILLKVRKDAVDNDEPSPTMSNRNIQLLGYASQLMMIEEFYNNDPKGLYSKELTNMTQDIKTKMYKLKEEADKIGQKDQDKFYFAMPFKNLVSALMYVLNDEKSALETYNMINPELVKDLKYKETVKGWKQDAAVSFFQAKALKMGFDSAKVFLEKEYPLTDNSLFTSYMPALIGVTDVVDTNGFVYKAVNIGKNQEANKALDYMYAKISTVLKDTSKINALSKDAKSVLIKGTKFANINKDVTNKFIRNGVTSLSSAFLAVNNKEKAIASLRLIDTYVNSLDSSIDKYENLMALANMALIAGDKNIHTEYYNKAMGIDIDSNSSATADDKTYMYISKAADTNYFSVENRASVVASNLEKALTFISQIGTTDKEYDRQVYYYTLISQEYYKINNTFKAQEMLLKAEETAKKINKGTYKQKAFSRIVKAYGYCELVDEGYNKAISLVNKADLTNRNILIKDLVTIVSDKNDYNSNKIHRKLSFIDTDKDGKPDFFYPWVKDEDKVKANLSLDNDIDGDSLDENNDLLPYVANK